MAQVAVASVSVAAPAAAGAVVPPAQSRMAALTARIDALLAGAKCAKSKRSNIVDVVDALQRARAPQAAIVEAASIFDDIENEQARVAKSMSDKLSKLDCLNELLAELSKPAAHSITQARRALKSVFINIYDLEAGRTDAVHESLTELRKYTKSKRLFFPREEAKEAGLRDILQVIFPRRWARRG